MRLNNRGQFSIIAALLVAVILIAAVMVTYSAVRYNLIQGQPQVLSAIDETNFAIKQTLGFTIGYYCSVLKVTGNSSYARTLAMNYLYSGLINIASTHPKWGASLDVNKDKTELSVDWFTNTSYSTGALSVTYDLTGLGIHGITYEASSRLTVQVKSIVSSNKTQLLVLGDEGEPLINLGKQKFKFYRYMYTNSTWKLVTPETEPIAFANGTYIVDIPQDINPYSYVVQVEDHRGLIVVASSFSRYVCTLAWNSTLAGGENYVDNNISNVDFSPDKGTHSNFPAQQHGPDSIYDILSEANTGEVVRSGYNVSQGYIEFGATSTTYDQVVHVSNLSHAFVLLHYYYGQPDSNVNHEPDEAMISAYLWNDTGTTKIRFTRGAQHNRVTRVGWQVIECFNKEFKVYRGSLDWSGTTTQYNCSIGAAVNASNCFAWVCGTTSDSTSRSTIRNHYFTAYVPSDNPTIVVIDRYAPSSAPSGTLRWIVVEFDVGGNFDGAIDTGEVTVTNQYYNNPKYFSISGCKKSQSILLAQTKTFGDDGLNTHATAVKMVNDTHGAAYTHDGNFGRDVRWYCIDFGPNSGSRQEDQVDRRSVSNWASEDFTLSPAVAVNRTMSYVSFTCDGDGTAFPRPTCYYWVSDSTNLAVRRPRYGQEGTIEWQILELPYSEDGGGNENYQLDLEVAWTTAIYNGTIEDLAIYASEGNNICSLDATGGYMIIGDGTPDWGSVRGTISFWIKWDSAANRSWGQHNNMEARFSGGNLVLDWGATNSLTSSTAFTVNKWYFIAIVWNENTDNLYLYVGDEENPPTLDQHNSAWTSTVSTVGVTQNNFMASKGGVDPTDGLGDDLRYWNVDRALTKIQNDYNIELTGSETNLKSYFMLNNNFDDIGPDNNDGSGSGSYSFSSDVSFDAPPTESLRVDVWTGSGWQNLITNITSGWNNVSVSPYLDSPTFTIRFKDNNETSDLMQDSWKIDAALLHVLPAQDLYLSLQDATVVVELLQNGTIRWLGQDMQLTTQAKPFPPIPVKAIHVNQTINGVSREVPFQIEDWASDYRIPLGLTANASIFNSRTMLVFLANPTISRVTIWWNGSDTTTQTPYAYRNQYFTVDTVQRTLTNGILDLEIDFSSHAGVNSFKVISTVRASTNTAEFMRINNEVAHYGHSEPNYAITNGTVRAIIQHEVEWDGGIPNCPDVYAHIVLTLPANATYYTYQLRFMFVESRRDRNVTELCPLEATVLTGQPQTENGTADGCPIVSNSTGLFYNASTSSSTHHWSQFISGDKGSGIMFTDSANRMLYFFDTMAGNKTGALKVSDSTDKTLELLPVAMAQVDFTSALDITWHGAVVTFDGTTPIYEIGNNTGLWVTVEYPPIITVTTES